MPCWPAPARAPACPGRDSEGTYITSMMSDGIAVTFTVDSSDTTSGGCERSGLPQCQISGSLMSDSDPKAKLRVQLLKRGLDTTVTRVYTYTYAIY